MNIWHVHCSHVPRHILKHKCLIVPTFVIVVVPERVDGGVWVHVGHAHHPGQPSGLLQSTVAPLYPPFIRHSFKIRLFTAARKLNNICEYHHLVQGQREIFTTLIYFLICFENSSNSLSILSANNIWPPSQLSTVF